ncbi:putative gtpase activating protein [Golovinomyces cichoracearum]|uniref:GTPase-activating protein GYP5 n=1 Tax=Golovinomyces cichoracearum TaxID=62708 RepID=A0A420IZM3_9PEZI|nr:putative gtpase activating protein [Golovinomyces cichoracearum]
MPDLEVNLEPPLLKSKSDESEPLDVEPEKFEDACEALQTKPPTQSVSTIELPLVDQQEHSKDDSSVKTPNISPTSSPTSKIPSETNGKLNQLPTSPTEQSSSPTLSSHSSPKDSKVSVSSNLSRKNTSDSNLQPSLLPNQDIFPPKIAATTKLLSKAISLSTSEVVSQVPPLPTQKPVQANHVPSVLSTRKLTSPFSWLSRNLGKDSTSATQSSNFQKRRDTDSSVATNGSNPETLNNGEQTNDLDGTKIVKRVVKDSLKDRFKLLRMQEEIESNPFENKEKKLGSELENWIKKVDNNSTFHTNDSEKVITSPLSLLPMSPNLLQSPNTPSSESAISSVPVDWDLWQSVVDEGPAAVSRTSPEELNRAIISGIPNVIRGVVWQILAQSKNEQLERVYRDLAARGTEKDQSKMNGSSGLTSVIPSSSSINGKEEVITSSASSVHSDQTNSSNSTTNSARSPSLSKESEVRSKNQATSAEEQKKKALDDAAALLKLEKTIKRDLGARTSFSKFATSAGLQESLFGVCKAYALFDEAVGYAQGMNFLAMPLLFNMPEDEAFCLLVKMMNQYHLRDLFIQDMPGLHMRLYLFERLLEDFEPALYCHLQRRQVSPHLYATQWFLTLFAYRFPLQLVLRIYDLILSEGLEAIIKIGIVLMHKNATTLLGMSDMTSLTKFLKDRLFDVYIDVAPSSGSILESGFFGSSASSIDKEVYRADQLIRDACAIKITPELLKTYTIEWEEKNRIEREREQEFETLRLSNKKLSHKVRRLEERVQDHDAEHAALATELVRTKVQNQELKDENESLKIQVHEFREMIEKLPQEVEQRLQTEMDRLLKRNQEVHDENTRLEEDMSEMEKTLVETKMQYAEINAAHETLTRKWIDLRKALGD